MTASEIITAFELYLDDSTQLSSVEELTLLNKIYKKVCRNRPWEFLRKTATGTLSTSVAYVSLPSDFSFFAEPKVVYVIKNGIYEKYEIINYNQKREHLNEDRYCYLDMANSRLVFTLQPTSAYSYEFDYTYMPSDLTTIDSPVLPSDFHPMIYHGMAVEDTIIQQNEKARSYAPENQMKYNDYLKDLAYYNAQFINL